MKQQIGLAHWWQSFVHHPLAALADAFRVLLDRGFLDGSTLWRQFYEASPADFLRWDSLLVYVTVCGLAYIVLLRNKPAGVSARQFLGYLLPRQVWSSR